MNTLLRTHILDNIHKIYSSVGTISTTKYNAKDNISLKTNICKATEFLPSTASASERIYCIRNNITNRCVCEMTSEYLKWSPNAQKYSQSKTMMYKNRIVNTSSIKQRYSDIKNHFNKCYETHTFNIISKDAVTQQIVKFKTNIKAWDIEKNIDLLCSVRYWTDFLPIDAQWGERFYCLKNNIDQRQISYDKGFCNYINSTLGYSKFSSKENKHSYEIEQIKKEVTKNFIILTDISNINKQRVIDIKCKKCNSVKQQLFICGLWQEICCNNCTGYGKNRSRAEDEINEFLQQYNINTIKNAKVNGIEIDLFIPDKAVGIEYNGVLWHSYGTTYPCNSHHETSGRQKHSIKNQICQTNNINLITVFENEWILKKDIVKSIILAKLNKLENRKYARKCSLVKLTKDEKKQFYIQNHIQGNCQSFLDYGLKIDNEIYAAMSFSHRKINANNQVELVRYCCKLNTSVVGGFSKLFKHCISQINEDIISYCDLRYSDGKSYLKNGFKLIRTSKPNFFYTKDTINLLSRLNFQKHKLKHFQAFDNIKTETEIMYEEGYRKIYDCGNLVFLYTKTVT